MGLSVIVAGGGTAGHIEPALAVADAIRRLVPDATVTALGTERGLETKLVPERGYPLELIPPVPLPRRLTPQLFGLPARVRSAVRAAREVIDRTEADVVVGFGGYVSLPAYLAARRGVFHRRRAVPVVIHEANAKAGLANRIGARYATRVVAAVDGTGLRGMTGPATIVGIPVRDSITSLDRAALRAQARQHFGLPESGPVLLVFGGSQGARSLNEAVSGAATRLADAGVSVLHAYGPKNSVEVANTNPAAPYVAVPYLSRMDLAYAAADLAVCRSGAMTVAEVSAVGLPAIYVPLPHGNGEQELNARPVVAAGGGLICHDGALTPDYIASDVVDLVTAEDRLTAMGRAAADSGHRDAARTVAAIVLEVAQG